MGTAALLNVPASLEKVLKELMAQGYDLGDLGKDLDGETLVAALKVRIQHRPDGTTSATIVMRI